MGSPDADLAVAVEDALHDIGGYKLVIPAAMALTILSALAMSAWSTSFSYSARGRMTRVSRPLSQPLPLSGESGLKNGDGCGTSFDQLTKI
jgi:hypothetical protein